MAVFQTMRVHVKKPNFFVVGFPRSGTTSLHYYLEQHPDVFVTKDKELQYFANDIFEEFLKSKKTQLKKIVLLVISFYLNHKMVLMPMKLNLKIF